jgi:hypothetical protein
MARLLPELRWKLELPFCQRACSECRASSQIAKGRSGRLAAACAILRKRLSRHANRGVALHRGTASYTNQDGAELLLDVSAPLRNVHVAAHQNQLHITQPQRWQALIRRCGDVDSASDPAAAVSAALRACAAAAAGSRTSPYDILRDAISEKSSKPAGTALKSGHMASFVAAAHSDPFAKNPRRSTDVKKPKARPRSTFLGPCSSHQPWTSPAPPPVVLGLSPIGRQVCAARCSACVLRIPV